jgi:hypothetical protein
MVEPMEEVCRRCRFYESHGVLQGICRRYPPSNPDSYTKPWKFPIVMIEYWCGEYRAPTPADPGDRGEG